MLAAVVIGAIVLLFLLAFVAPRLSIRPQRKIDHALEQGEGKGHEAPEPAGRWIGKSFRGIRRTADGSASAGRKSRWHLPF